MTQNASERRPAFIVSFDCEGKWGLSDDLGVHAALTSQALKTAYQRLCGLLERYSVKASFAFVAAFTMSEEEAVSKLSLFKEVGPRTEIWLKPFLSDLKRRQTDGWLAPQAFSVVKEHAAHEIASHGFSHLPIGSAGADQTEFAKELENIHRTSSFAGRTDLSFVYPRNQIGFAQELPRRGFLAYRDSPEYRSRLTANWPLVRELDAFPRAQKHPSAVHHELVAVPGGRFLNWRHGLRANIPIRWTVAGWRRAIADSIKNGGITHLWTHPHNFITGRDMFDLFEEILNAAAGPIRAGQLWNPTMKEYALALRGPEFAAVEAKT